MQLNDIAHKNIEIKIVFKNKTKTVIKQSSKHN